MNEKKLGFGFMRLPLLDENDEASIDIEQTKKMVDVFLERGFTYFDTAWMYCGFRSENAIKEALTDRYPRDRYTIATKLHADFLKSKEDRDAIFYQQLEKTGAQYFDYYLLHDAGRDLYKIYTEMDCFRWLAEKKEQGLIKHIGFSCHDNAEMVDRVFTDHPEMEFVLLQINYLDWENDGIQSRKCYETAVKHGKDVIVMEPVKGGTLARVPEEVERMFKECHPDWSVPSWGIRFAASLEHVKVVLSGMSSLDQMLENTGYMAEFTPMTEKEIAIVEKAVDLINANITVACTGCSYCTGGCPENIPIPKYFSLYNADLQETKEKIWLPQNQYYARLAKTFGKASDCIECGQCEQICPQQLPIIQYLKDVAKHFEK